jgi:hypothetical protein
MVEDAIWIRHLCRRVVSFRRVIESGGPARRPATMGPRVA